MTTDSLSELISSVEDRHKRVLVYAPEEESGNDVVPGLTARNATVERRSLPDGESNGFVVIRQDGEFRGSVSLSELHSFTELPIRDPWDLESRGSGYRALFELLDDTLFASLERRQLLAASREIEERAWRVGDGELRVGFQNPTAFDAQRTLYERFGLETDVDLHAYVEAVPTDEASLPFPIHTEPSDEVSRFWFLAYDGGSGDRQDCALLAEQRDVESYYGLWTYDPDLVEDLFSVLRRFD